METRDLPASPRAVAESIRGSVGSTVDHGAGARCRCRYIVHGRGRSSVSHVRRDVRALLGVIHVEAGHVELVRHDEMRWKLLSC